MDQQRETIKTLIANGVFQRWLDGEEMQIRNPNTYGGWGRMKVPNFTAGPDQYRIKPELKRWSRWSNVYITYFTSTYGSRELADHCADPDRLAVLRLDYEEIDGKTSVTCEMEDA